MVHIVVDRLLRDEGSGWWPKLDAHQPCARWPDIRVAPSARAVSRPFEIDNVFSPGGSRKRRGGMQGNGVAIAEIFQ